MNAKQLIELQQEHIELQRAEITRKEAEIDAAYAMVITVCQTVMGDTFGSAPCKFAAEQAFKRLVAKLELTTAYTFEMFDNNDHEWVGS